ncbi:YchJ family protein [Glycomyces tenuis]|uniref:YchJ family protein n=1 Tax=Glycomyces tenuis TaxID=58116 RepID=UPI0006857BC3|nr:YchJ family protein [Glycomyces tenuis]
MARRSRQPRRPVRRAPERDCPCGAGGPYDACCGRLHAGDAGADTAEALMRSRYSAFALGDVDYLLRTWHPDTRPARLDLDGGRRWTGLEVLETSGGTAFHSSGTVTFRAHYRDAEGPGAQEETSEFLRLDGAWVYR